MENFKRYAVYYAPAEGDFAARAAAWLGAVQPFALPASIGRSLHDVTAAPRKYGFHGTIRAPFRPQGGQNHAAICHHVQRIAEGLKPIQAGVLQLVDLHGFLALVPSDPAALNALAAQVVVETDPLRAPLTPAEIARRRPDQLSPRQNDLLARWGYPYVMEEFRFHLTLTDQLLPEEVAPLIGTLKTYFAPDLAGVFCVKDLCLFGEDADGRFHLLHRYALSG
jgi:hypothetical protein